MWSFHKKSCIASCKVPVATASLGVTPNKSPTSSERLRFASLVVEATAMPSHNLILWWRIVWIVPQNRWSDSTEMQKPLLFQRFPSKIERNQFFFNRPFFVLFLVTWNHNPPVDSRRFINPGSSDQLRSRHKENVSSAERELQLLQSFLHWSPFRSCAMWVEIDKIEAPKPLRMDW